MRITQSGKVQSVSGDGIHLTIEGFVASTRKRADIPHDAGEVISEPEKMERIYCPFSIKIPDNDVARAAFGVGTEIHVTIGHPPWPKVGVVKDDKADPER